jgi:CubicO group peptidase (beta-lactamase class C family)
MHYSNFGAAVLGVALTHAYEKATFHEMVEEVVLRPLDLTATTAEPGKTQAEGHAFRRRPAPYWHLDGLAGAGALRSTARDLLSYLRSQLEPDLTPLAEAIRLTHVLLKPGGANDRGPGLDAQLQPRGPDVLAQRRHRRFSQLRWLPARPWRCRGCACQRPAQP